MRRLIPLLLFVAATTAHAGLVYQFESRTDVGNVQMSGRTLVEGKGMRIELTHGDRMLFRDGSVIVSSDGGQTMFVLDPATKSYDTFSTQQLIGSLNRFMNSSGGDFKIDVANQKVAVSGPQAGPMVQGYPTKKYVVDTAWDLNVNVLGSTVTMKMHSINESWTTDRIDPSFANVFQKGSMQTGIASLDRLIEAQSAAVKGFPLRSVTKATTTTNGRTQTVTTTVEVSGIKQQPLAPTLFAVPAGYVKRQVHVRM